MTNTFWFRRDSISKPIEVGDLVKLKNDVVEKAEIKDPDTLIPVYEIYSRIGIWSEDGKEKI